MIKPFLILLGLLCLTHLRAARPNVVLILIDDLSHYGVTAYGATHLSERDGLFKNVPFSTPNMDRLAAEGLRCDHAYAYPLCESTRIALMSGQLNSRNFLQCKAQNASEITFGDVFQRAGYVTGMFGKWKQSRGTRETPAKDYIFEFGWDEFTCFDIVGAGQRFINPNLVMNGEVHNYQGRTDLDPATGRRWYGPDICNRNALQFIENHKDEAFFLYYPMLLVHAEHKPTPDTQPHSVFDEFPEEIKGKGDDKRFFPDMLAYTDKLIGKVVHKLDELKLREHTLIVVMGDNGTKEPFIHVLPDGSTYQGGKGGNKDNGLHVPLIFSMPGTVPAGQPGSVRSYDGLVDVVDIYPTIGAAAGLTIPNPKAIDGVSHWRQVLGEPGEQRQAIYTWYNGNNPATSQDTVLAYAFNRHFKRYAPDTKFPQGRFFDLRADPMEEAGDRTVKLHWIHYLKSGLSLDQLTPEQLAAYRQLGDVLDAHRPVAVTALQVGKPADPWRVGVAQELTCRIIPAEATRQNIIWESSDPAVASVDKFGVVTPHAPGRARVTVYSWEDASPSANDAKVTFLRTGIQNSINIEVGLLGAGATQTQYP